LLFHVPLDKAHPELWGFDLLKIIFTNQLPLLGSIYL
jgi:hypothetical protein